MMLFGGFIEGILVLKVCLCEEKMMIWEQENLAMDEAILTDCEGLLL